MEEENKNDNRITIKDLEVLKEKTNDKYTKILIDDLKQHINRPNYNEKYIQFELRRIVGDIAHEKNKEKLQKFKKNKYKDVAYHLMILLRGKKMEMTLNGEFNLSEVSNMIQKEFDLEPMHLYEFNIGGLKYGPECDEWQEMFDELDDFKLGAAISAAGLKNGDKFRFLYDFGDNIKFKIEILNIKKLDLNFKK